MTETYYPRWPVEQWTELISSEVRRHASPAPTFDLDDIEALLRAAEERARPRTTLPPQLNRFPFTLFAAVPPLILKCFKLLFQDQRAVNATLIQALRETLAVNRYLVARLAARDEAGGRTEGIPSETVPLLRSNVQRGNAA